MPAQYAFGFDVSRYQENVQWDRVKAAGMEFVFVQGNRSVGIPLIFSITTFGDSQVVETGLCSLHE